MYQLIRQYLFWRSRHDAEIAHEMTLRLLANLERFPLLLSALRLLQEMEKVKPVTVMGIQFSNPLMLAAGCSKNAEALGAFASMGFGGIEVGSILPQPQPGRPRPRMFRLDRNLINRMGFNSQGARIIAQRHSAYEASGVLRHTRIGLNYGKMATTEVDDVGRAAQDYIDARNYFIGLGDYNVANVSSPNTENLRTLQHSLERFLKPIIENERTIRDSKPLPWVVKISADGLEDDATLDAVLTAIVQSGAQGISLPNTTTLRPPEITHHQHSKEMGGLSGQVGFQQACGFLTRVVARKTRLPIFFSRGIDHPQKLRTVLDEGASVVQLYTPLVYGGLELIRQLRRGLRTA